MAPLCNVAVAADGVHDDVPSNAVTALGCGGDGGSGAGVSSAAADDAAHALPSQGGVDGAGDERECERASGGVATGGAVVAATVAEGDAHSGHRGADEDTGASAGAGAGADADAGTGSGADADAAGANSAGAENAADDHADASADAVADADAVTDAGGDGDGMGDSSIGIGGGGGGGGGGGDSAPPIAAADAADAGKGCVDAAAALVGTDGGGGTSVGLGVGDVDGAAVIAEEAAVLSDDALKGDVAEDKDVDMDMPLGTGGSGAAAAAGGDGVGAAAVGDGAGAGVGDGDGSSGVGVLASSSPLETDAQCGLEVPSIAKETPAVAATLDRDGDAATADMGTSCAVVLMVVSALCRYTSCHARFHGTDRGNSTGSTAVPVNETPRHSELPSVPRIVDDDDDDDDDDNDDDDEPMAAVPSHVPSSTPVVSVVSHAISAMVASPQKGAIIASATVSGQRSRPTQVHPVSLPLSPPCLALTHPCQSLSRSLALYRLFRSVMQAVVPAAAPASTTVLWDTFTETQPLHKIPLPGVSAVVQTPMATPMSTPMVGAAASAAVIDAKVEQASDPDEWVKRSKHTSRRRDRVGSLHPPVYLCRRPSP